MGIDGVRLNQKLTVNADCMQRVAACMHNRMKVRGEPL